MVFQTQASQRTSANSGLHTPLSGRPSSIFRRTPAVESVLKTVKCIFWNLVVTPINGFVLILSVGTHNWSNCARHAKCCICWTGTWHWAWTTSSRLFLSLHAQVEKRLLSVDIDRLSPKPELSKGESGLNQSSGSYRKMKEIASQEDTCPTSWKERWGRIWGVAHHGASWVTQAPGVGQSIPVRGCSHLPAVAARQRGRNLEPMRLTACFIR